VSIYGYNLLKNFQAASYEGSTPSRNRRAEST
jgi:hypothetical protein